MKVFLFTDPHLGRTNQSHTTTDSRKRFKGHLFEVAKSYVRKASGLGVEGIYCLGDLFDKSNNSEGIVAQGAAISSRCDRVLAGNHDLTNRAGSYSSFELLEEVGSPVSGPFVLSPDPGQPYFQQDPPFFWVPHCYTQEVFEQSVRDAAAAAAEDDTTYLMLHCSLGSYGEESSDSSALYLTDELKKLVGEAFTRVFVGHEHVPAQEGNITVLGNTYPLAYGELGDRYAYVLDTDTDELTPIKMVSKDDVYQRMSVEKLLQGQPAVAPMVEITGEAKWDQQPEIAKAVMRLWKEGGDTLFSVKNSIKMEEIQSKFEMVDVESYSDALYKAAKEAGFEEELNDILEGVGQ